MVQSTLMKTLRLLFLYTFISIGESRRYVHRRTRSGPVRGVVRHVYGGGRVERFLGIPYAQPPIGQLRFERNIEESLGTNGPRVKTMRSLKHLKVEKFDITPILDYKFELYCGPNWSAELE
ncbi:hypothetical protein RRG08_056623 [Elysia crispata]|uniref:Carboxylesterase type B domain-containing protein n=1 Tax=Elysia crispata TaxID=231223 RepID=A0AAE1B2E1_9GAST|nr:hypothetical protein RRG08_056623 [Elysia crispata]